ncbi:MAG: hypothetical protein ACOH5I_09020 [Oligoflexus sp.]
MKIKSCHTLFQKLCISSGLVWILGDSAYAEFSLFEPAKLTQIQYFPLVGGFYKPYNAGLGIDNYQSGEAVSFTYEDSKYWYGKRYSFEFYKLDLVYEDEDRYLDNYAMQGERYGARYLVKGWSVLTGTYLSALIYPGPILSFSIGWDASVDHFGLFDLPPDSPYPLEQSYTDKELQDRLDSDRKWDLSIGPIMKLSAEYKLFFLIAQGSVTTSLKYSIHRDRVFRDMTLMLGGGGFWVHQ